MTRIMAGKVSAFVTFDLERGRFVYRVRGNTWVAVQKLGSFVHDERPYHVRLSPFGGREDRLMLCDNLRNWAKARSNARQNAA